MKKFGLFATAVTFCISAPAFAQFGSIFQSAVENAAKQAVQQGTQQGVQQGVVQAINGAPAQPVAALAPIMQNGCYFNLPAMPPGVQFNADLNSNGCVDQNEFATYMQVYQSAMASAAQRQPTPSASGNAAGAVLGSAVAARNAGLNGNATAWVAGQNALGAAVSAAHAQPPAQAQVIAANPVDFNGDGIVTAEEVAAYQARSAAANGAVPAGAQGAVSNTTSEVVSGAVSGALKGLFGH